MSQEELIQMSQKERDRVKVLDEAKQRQITQKQAAEQVGVTERWVRKLLARMRKEGDRAVVHRLRGRQSNRRIPEAAREKAVALVRREYGDFGPTLAREYLAERHGIEVSRETVRQWMMGAQLWKPRRARIEQAHTWRPRRAQCGELVQWEGRSYPIARACIRPGLRGARVRVEKRLDGSVAVRFREHYLAVTVCEPRSPRRQPVRPARRSRKPASEAPPHPGRKVSTCNRANQSGLSCGTNREGRRRTRPAFCANSSRPTGSFR